MVNSRVAPSFFFCKQIYFGRKLRVWRDRTCQLERSLRKPNSNSFHSDWLDSHGPNSLRLFSGPNPAQKPRHPRNRKYLNLQEDKLALSLAHKHMFLGGGEC